MAFFSSFRRFLAGKKQPLRKRELGRKSTIRLQLEQLEERAVPTTTPTISWAAPAAITYGTALGGAQLDASASSGGSPVMGTFTYTLADDVTPASGAVLSADNNQVLNVSFAPMDTTDYSTATAQVEISVTAAVISFKAVSFSMTYDGSTTSALMPLPTLTGSIHGTGEVTYSQAFESKDVLGTNGSTLVPIVNINPAYSLDYFNKALTPTTGTITAESITITPNNQTKPYGFGGTSAALGTSGFSPTTGTIYNGEITGVTLTTPDTTSTSGNYKAGTYSLTPSLATGSFNAADYNITYATDTNGLVISGASLTVSGISSTSRGYNASTIDALSGTAALSGTIIGSDNVTLTGTGVGTLASANAGPEAVTISGYGITGADAGDYILSQPTVASATIGQAAVTVTATNQTQTYGFGALGTTGFSVSGTIYSSDSITGVTLATNDTTSGSGNYNVGTYNLTPSAATGTGGFNATNYNIAYDNGTLAVSAENLTIKAVTDSKTYNDSTSSAATPTIVGTVYDSEVTYSQYFTSKNVEGANGSCLKVTYAVNASAAGDYNVTTQSAKGTITAENVTLAAVFDSKPYDSTTSSTGTPMVTVGTNYGGEISFSQAFESANVLGSGNSTLAVSYLVSTSNSTISADYNVSTQTHSGTITTATPSVSVTVAGGVYNGSPFAATNASVTGVGSDGTIASFGNPALSYKYYQGGTLLGSAPVNPGAYTVVAVYTSTNANYANASSTAASFSITPGLASAVVNGYNVTIGTHSYSLAGVQRSMVDNIVFTFNYAVTPAAGAFSIAFNTSASTSGPADATFNKDLPTLAWSNPSSDGKTWVVTFSGTGVVGNSIADGVYKITVNAADVYAAVTIPGTSNVQDVYLAANVTNTFYRLFGDATGIGQVNAVDLLAMEAAETTYQPYFDSNADGLINTTDLSAIELRYGVKVIGFTATI